MVFTGQDVNDNRVGDGILFFRRSWTAKDLLLECGGSVGIPFKAEKNICI